MPEIFVARQASAIASGRLCRRGSDARRHYAEDGRQAWVRRASRRPPNAIRTATSTRASIPVHREDGSLALDREEYPRPQTTLEGLAVLKPAFTAVADYPLDDTGTTYRNLILQKISRPGYRFRSITPAIRRRSLTDRRQFCWHRANYAKAHSLKPRARVVAMANMGDSPP